MLNMLLISIGALALATPVAGVDEVVIAGAQHAEKVASGLSFFQLFLQADVIVKCVILLLVFASIWTWAIIFEKVISLKLIKGKMKQFERDFWSGISFDRLFKQVKGREDNPLAMVFTAALDEIQVRGVAQTQTTTHYSATSSERVRQATQLASNKAIDLIERNLDFLAMVGSCAPFVGLFGTVWGIMVSFQSIAAAKNTTLAVVAPGIAEALLATALGLVAAIPAVIFYNRFASEVNRLAGRVQAFVVELNNMILRELDDK